MNIFDSWLPMNMLMLNTEKTRYMIFKQKDKTEIKINLRINGQEILRTDLAQYLGIEIDNK